MASTSSSILLLVALTDVVTLLDARALATAGVGVRETGALLVLALGEGGDLLGALELVRVLEAQIMLGTSHREKVREGEETLTPWP